MSDYTVERTIEMLKQIDCDCGYHFERIEDDKHLYTFAEMLWMQNHKGKYVICPGCKKKTFNMENVEYYLRNQKLKRLCQTIRA